MQGKVRACAGGIGAWKEFCGTWAWTAGIVVAGSLACPPCVEAQGIVADGRTVTTVSTSATGHDTVTIASPVNGGVSYNSYTQFNVTQAGADFDNTRAGARLIVNEVTGSSPSSIEGQIGILGQRANFVLANENGITVNGGSFVNTGAVALSTGKVEIKDYQVTPDVVQRNVLLHTSQGTIQIGPGGLSGAFTHLDLIAKNLKIAGAVVDTFDNANSYVRLVAGQSLAEIDSSVSPSDEQTPWIYYNSARQKNSDVVVDITPLGSLSAGRVEVMVTDQGAGVHDAGSAFARDGDFVLSSSGDVRFDGAQVQAAGYLVVQSPSLEAGLGADGSGATFRADNDVQFLSPSITMRGVSIQAGTDQQAGSVLFGDPSVDPVTAMSLTGAEGAQGYVSFQVRASGGMLINSKNQDLDIEGADVDVLGTIDITAAATKLVAQATANGWHAGNLSAEGGDFSLDATGDITIQGTQIQGGAKVNLEGGAFQIASLDSGAGGLIAAAITSNGGSIQIGASAGVSLAGADILADQNIDIQAGHTVHLQPVATTPARMVAVNGELDVNTSGQLINESGLLQGNAPDAQLSDSTAAVNIQADQGVTLKTTQPSNLAIIFGQAGDVVIGTKGDFTNDTGRVVSNAALDIQADGDVRDIIHGTSDGYTGKTTTTKRRKRFLLFFHRTVKTTTANYGAPLIPGQLAYLVANGDVSIKAKDVIQQGGEIDANDGDVNIVATGTIRDDALRFGVTDYSKDCTITCDHHADSTVTMYGGGINASKSVNLTAGSEVTVNGGAVLGLDSVTVQAPTTSLSSVPTYYAIDQSHGMSSWFGSTYGHLFRADVGGTLTAGTGDVMVEGDLVNDGGATNATAGKVEVTGKRMDLRQPVEETIYSNWGYLGLFSPVL